MNHKAFRAVFLGAVALGVLSVLARMTDTPIRPPTARKEAPSKTLARPMACFQVYEDKTEHGMDYRGAIYKAKIDDTGFLIGGVPMRGSVWAQREYTVEFGKPRVEQGAMRLECDNGKYSRTGFGKSQIDRGAVIEEYVFENRRVEQNFRIPAPVAEGELRLSIPVRCDLGGPAVVHEPRSGKFEGMEFRDGGIAFTDSVGATRLAYHSAVAVDAAGRTLALAPRLEHGEIALCVPASFMSEAVYPVVVDPWLDFAGSGVDGGVTQNNGAFSAINPVLTMQGTTPFLCWSDNTAATTANPTNTAIYLKYWNGFEFTSLGTSAAPGGISQTAGTASNPTMCFTPLGGVAVAWEDNSLGPVGIFMKLWPGASQAGAGAWSVLGTQGNISPTFSAALHPSIGCLAGVVPGTVTTNPSTGVTTSTPATFVDCPVVAYDCNPGGGSIQVYCFAWYPGAPPQPQSTPFPLGLPSVPAGWWQMGLPGGGAFVQPDAIFPLDSISQASAGASAQYPSLVIDGNNHVAIAWQDSSSGLYRIYFKVFADNPAGQSNLFQVAPNPNNATNENDMFPAGSFAAIGGSATGAGLSTASGSLSQFPSMSFDTEGNTGNFTVAWQETEAAAPPNPGTSSQIYVSRSVNGGAFAGLDGSTGPGGISQTLNDASTPSCAVGGGYIGVAWADDSNGRSSIYARRFYLGVGGSGLWEQIGFQGSAFPALNGELTAPIGGVSQSNNFSIQPSIQMDAFGDPLIAWADGSQASFDILLKVFSPNGPGIATGVGTNNTSFVTDLRQTLTDPTLGPATDIMVAGFAGSGTEVFLSSRVFTETLIPAGTSLRLEIEVQRQGQPFTNSPNFQTLFVAPDSPTVTPMNTAVLDFQGLPNANYHWQARTADQVGRSSPWIIFPTDVNGVSFRINLGGAGATNPGGTTPNGPANVGSTNGSGGPSRHMCGLTGLEALALLGALRLLRRRVARTR